MTHSTTDSPRRPPRRSPGRSPGASLIAIATSLGLTVAAPLLLVGAALHRLGHSSPVHGMTAPWSWTVRGVRRWFSDLGGSLETSDALIDLLFRVGLAAAWICLVVLIGTVVAEVVFQLRHGMPSTPRRASLGVGRLARFIATGLVAVLPMGANSAFASTDSLVRPTSPTVSAASGAQSDTQGYRQSSDNEGEVVGRLTGLQGDGVDGTDAASRGTEWSPRLIDSGDSVWSIAERIADGRDVAAVAQEIVAANLGRTMADGQQFTTPALIEPGWSLIVPAAPVPRPPMAAAPSAVAASAMGSHTVVAGDSYWGIAEHRLAADVGVVAPIEVRDATMQLIEINAPRLGYRDPTLLIPGDTVAFLSAPVTTGRSDLEPLVEPAITDVLPPAPLVVVPAVVVPAVVVPVVDTTPTVQAPVVTSTPAQIPAPTPASPVVSSTATRSANTTESTLGTESALGGAVALAAGALALLESRRRRQLRASQVGQRLSPVGVVERRVEAQLRSMSDGDVIARLDIALRSVAREVASQSARVLFAVIERDGTLTITLDRPCAPAAHDVWTSVAVEQWQLDGGTPITALAERSRRNSQPCPAMVHLGRTANGLLFVDLEALGLLSLDVGDEIRELVTRHIASSLAVSPFGDTMRLITVGLDDEVGLGAHDAEAQPSLDAALDAASIALGNTPAMSRASGSTFSLRASASTESWGPAIVVVGGVSSEEAGQVDLAGLCGSGGRGLGVVIDVALPEARWTLRERQGVCTLLPAGIDVTPVGLTRRDLVALDNLIAGASEPLAAPRHPALALVGKEPLETVVARDVAEQPWSLMVRLLGPVAVTDREGSPVGFERSKALELVVWLSQHRQRATRTSARTALWDLDVRDATFANVVSDARRALARAVVPPDGEEWIGRTLTESLPIHTGVVTDAELLDDCMQAARGLSSMAARAVLRPALERIAGMPFSGTSYLWPDAEGITSSLTLLAVGAATEYANHALDAADYEDVYWATGKGLQALPGHEELIAIRMRAHAARGDMAGVRNEWEAYERVLLADAWCGGEPSTKLVALRRQLLAQPLAS